jgi:hypothetical protein
MKLQSSSTNSALVISFLIRIDRSHGSSSTSSASSSSAWNSINNRNPRRRQQVRRHRRRRAQEVDENDEQEIDKKKGTKKCTIDGDFSCTTTFYKYKEFENGVTFSAALAATGYYPDLYDCVLAPIYSYTDLLEISDSIPPCKAAYTAANKDPLKSYREKTSCIENGNAPTLSSSRNCDLSSHIHADDSGLCSIDDLLDNNFTDWCPDLKMHWFNFGSKEEIPLEVWQTGYSSSYCGDGPIQNAAAAFATDYTSGEPIAALKAINSGEYLSGAVYKCCQDIVTCYS